MAKTDTDKRVVASSSVDQDDKTGCHVAHSRIDTPTAEWTLLSYKAYRLIGSDSPLRQAEEIPEKKTGVSLFVAGRASNVFQLGQF